MQSDFHEWLKSDNKAISNELLLFVAQNSTNLPVEDKDIVQEVMVKALQKTPTATDRASRMAWLRTLCRHHICDIARRLPQRATCLSEKESDDSQTRFDVFLDHRESSIGGKLLRSERKEFVTNALARLSDDERRAVILKHFENQTAAEIGERLKRSAEAVRSLLARAENKLRSVLGDDIF